MARILFDPRSFLDLASDPDPHSRALANSLPPDSAMFASKTLHRLASATWKQKLQNWRVPGASGKCGRVGFGSVSCGKRGASGANLQQASLAAARLVAAKLSGANMKGAQLQGPELQSFLLQRDLLAWVMLGFRFLLLGAGARMQKASLAGVLLQEARLGLKVW